MIEYGGLVVSDELSEEALSIPDELIASQELHEESIPLTPLLLGAQAEATGIESDDEDASAEPDLDDEKASQYDRIPLSDDPVRDYLRKIARHPLIDAAKEVDLSKAIEAGLYAEHILETEEVIDAVYAEELGELKRLGSEAHTTMILSNLRLVVSIAKRYSNKNMDFLEIIQEGNLGLSRAVEKFDYAKGFKFSTYATWWIRQSITRGIADKARTIRLPVHVVEEVNRVNKYERAMNSEGLVATPEQIATELDMPLERVRELIRIKKEPVSFNLSLEDGGGRTPGHADNTLGDLLPDKNANPEEDVEARLLQEIVRQRLAKCFEGNERSIRILIYRHGLDGNTPMTLEAVGRRIGLTRERVRQLEKRDMEKLQADEVLRGIVTAYLGSNKKQPQS